MLTVTGLTRHFREPAGGNLTVLDGLSFQVARGEAVAVVGPSGSGKSTLLGLLAGLDRPDGGRVEIEGADLAAMSETAMAAFRGRRLGFLFQQYRLLPALTAEDNVRLPLQLAGRRDAAAVAAVWLDRVGLADRAQHLPAQLSGGEQQRVALARALAPGPALLLADEPTGNLDQATAATVTDLVFGLVREHQLTTVIVTHDATLASRADRVLRLDGGRLAC